MHPWAEAINLGLDVAVGVAVAIGVVSAVAVAEARTTWDNLSGAVCQSAPAAMMDLWNMSSNS